MSINLVKQNKKNSPGQISPIPENFSKYNHRTTSNHSNLAYADLQ